jgi:uncharacterized damage-inducible protein DinB
MSPRRLADHIRRTFGGPMWHGPALSEVLLDVTAEQAAARPVAGAHTIWELVLHITVWAEIAAARLRGEALEYPPPEDDWPAMPEPTAYAWKAAVERLGASYGALADAVEPLTEEALRSTVAGQDHPTWAMLHGVVEHACYHGGQIAILKRAVSSPLGGTPSNIPSDPQ